MFHDEEPAAILAAGFFVVLAGDLIYALIIAIINN